MEPNTPQPGRIAPKASSMSATQNFGGIQKALHQLPEQTKADIDKGFAKMLSPATGMAVNAGKSKDVEIAVTNRNKLNDFAKNRQMGGNMEIPSSEKRLTPFGRVAFIGFAALVDATEFVLDGFAVGVVVNRIIDMTVGAIFLAYFFYKGLSIADNSSVFGSIIGTIAGEFIPLVDIAPFFALDAWYITRAIKMKDKANQTAIDSEVKAVIEEQQRQAWIQNYQEQNMMEQAEELEE